jgi:CubicO group peptidase (beta-lactamase class C family)
MYLVAGEVIHRVSGQTWEAFITNRLFHELGMNHTYAGFDMSKEEKSHETPHFLIKDSVFAIKNLTYQNIGPAGGVWSCAADMDKWMMFLLDSGYNRERKQLLSAASYQELFKPQSMVTKAQFYPTAELTKPNWTTYGLGWFQEDYRGKMLQFHTGSLDGAVAIIGLVPSAHFGIYVFGNLDHSEIRHALMYKAIDLWCFNDDSRDWSGDLYAMYKGIREKQKKAQEEKDAMVVTSSRPSLPLASYAGQYSSEIYGDAEVQQQGDSLRVILPNDINMQLSHRDFDNYNGIYNYFWWDHSLVRFSLDTEGKVTQMDIDGHRYSRRER